MEKQAEVKVDEPVVDLAAQARAEWEAENKETETPDAEPSEKKPDEEKPEPPKDEPKEEPKEEVKPEEKPADGKVEDKPVEKKEEEKVATPEEEKVIQDWAIKHSLTLAEAKEDLEKTKGVVQKYKSPEEMARALRQMQSQYDKMKNEAGKEEKDPYQISANPQLEVFEYVRTNATDIVEKYRQSYPARTRDMEDDAILEEVADKLLTGYKGWNDQRVKVLQTDASKRREELLSSLNERDRRFLPDIKAVIDKTSDKVIVSKGFNLDDIVRWAKGAEYDRAIKEAEERGARQEREKAKILGVVPSSRTETTSTAKSGGVRLSEYEKKLAREMFSTTTFSDEEKYEAYAEVAKKKKK